MGRSKTKRFKSNILIYELIISHEAAIEIIDAVRYYEKQQVGLGKRFLMHLEKYFDNIQAYPEHYYIKRKPYREAFIKSFLT